jgi:hypothetical protein
MWQPSVVQPVPEAGPAVRRPWWSAAPLPPLPPISTRRAYTEVLLVFAAFFLAGVVSAGILLGGRYRNPLVNGSWSDYAPQFVDTLAQTGLAVAVVLLLSARRGVTPGVLGLRLPRRGDGRFAAGQATRILAWAIFALVLGGIINASLQTGHLPTSRPDAAELIYAMAASVQAGVVEELVVLAFAVVTLRQAGRPLWEITVVVLVLRGSYHVYYGPGVIGILVWAALFYWIYLRTGNIVLLMVGHTGWDAIGFLSQRWPGVAGFGILVAVAIWIAAPITWLVERNNLQQPQVGARGGPRPPPSPDLPPAGWQPDPAGLYRWRWWDGQRWTEYVSGP